MADCLSKTEEVAEDYCLGRLDAEAAVAFEAHYLACPRCAQLVESTQDFLMSFRLLMSRESVLAGSDTTFSAD
ncbi:MAG: zf-HC2 domain-containing protein [Acidobacteriia bacterium]|nr:zf-HC2 domain-containing protein [Terriglobia bacterium]